MTALPWAEAACPAAAGAVAHSPLLTCRIIAILRVLQESSPGTDVIALAVLPRANYIQAGQQVWPSIFTPGIQLMNDKVKAYVSAQSKAHFLDCGQRFIVDNHVGVETCCAFCCCLRCQPQDLHTWWQEFACSTVC